MTRPLKLVKREARKVLGKSEIGLPQPSLKSNSDLRKAYLKGSPLDIGVVYRRKRKQNSLPRMQRRTVLYIYGAKLKEFSREQRFIFRLRPIFPSAQG